MVIIGCKKLENNTTQPKDIVKNSKNDLVKSETKDTINRTQMYNKQDSANITEKIKTFLIFKYKTELKSLNEKDRKFSYYEVDLNEDEKTEYFVRLEGNYFCGSRGCSFYLLNNDFTINTYFTNTNPPIFRSSFKTNGWNDLILFGKTDKTVGVKNYILLKFDKNKNRYPSNPTLAEKSKHAPNGHDLVMWHKEFGNAPIVYSF